MTFQTQGARIWQSCLTRASMVWLFCQTRALMVWQTCLTPMPGVWQPCHSLVPEVWQPCLYFLRRQKKPPNQMLKFYALKGKSVSILHPKKLKWTILSMPNVFYRKDNPTHNCMLSEFLWKWQLYHYIAPSIMICIFVNNKRINSETIILYNDVIHSKNTISFVFLVNKYTLSNPSHWNSTFAVSFIYKEFWWKEWGTVENHTIIWINTSLFVFICQAMVKNTILV